MKISNLGGVSLIGLMFAGMGWVSPAWSQQSPPSAQTAAQTGTIGDIVVTATKREQRLQDVPISITAVSQKQLEANRVLNTQDLQLLKPSLVYNELGGFAQPYLRGIGTDVESADVDPSVATYIDGAFLADSQSTIQNLLGVERIEIVAGPQGTLYGRNAVAGAINIITLTPKQDLESRESISYGNYNSIDASARLSGGITDNLAVGIYGALSSRDSYYDRLDHTASYPPETAVGDRKHQENWGVRFKAVWTPINSVKLTGSVQVAHTFSPDVTAFRQIQPNATGYALGAPVDIGYDRLKIDYPAENHNQQVSTNLREEVDIGDHQLVGITAYNDVKGYTSNDLDGTTAPLYGSDENFTNRHFSQEIQLLSPKGRWLQYIVGAYFWDQHSFSQARNSSLILFLPAAEQVINSRVNTRSYAGFAEVTVTPIENLRLTAGGRYTNETKSAFDGYQLFRAPSGAQLGATTAYPDGQNTYSKFTPKLSVDYRIGGTLLYGSYSKGFKSGVYNMASPGDAPVKPEVLTAYEIGSKSDFADGHLRLNLSAYYYDFNGLQVQVVTAGSGGLSSYQNSDGATAYGFEAALTALVTSDLRFTAQGAYEHGTYKNYPGYTAYAYNSGNDCPAAGNLANCPVVVNVKGNGIQRAPRWVGSLAVDYTKQMASGGSFNADANVYYNGGYYWDPAHINRQPQYALVNSSLGYTLPGGHLTISAFVSNIFNQQYEVQKLALVFGTLATDGAPRTYGGSVAYKF